MRFQDKKCLLVLCVILVLNFGMCFGSKNDKKHDKKKEHHHQKTTTASPQQHNNHTNAHQHQNNHTNVHSSDPKPDIGWSMNNNPNHPTPNPNGYALQHHEQSQQGHHQQAPVQHTQVHQNQAPDSGSSGGHHQQAPVQQTQVQQNQVPDSGSSGGIGAMGGLALGALGGAAGGYMLSNALNSNDKSGEKGTEVSVENATTLISETTLSTLSLEANGTTIDNTSVDVSNSTVIPEAHEALNTTISDNSTLADESIQSVSNISTVEPKLEQKAAIDDHVTTQTPQTVSGSNITKFCLTTFILSFVLHLITFY